MRMDHCFAKKIFGEKPMKKIDTSHPVNANEHPAGFESMFFFLLHHQMLAFNER